MEKLFDLDLQIQHVSNNDVIRTDTQDSCADHCDPTGTL